MSNDFSKEQRPDTPHYDEPTGGWGSVKGMLRLMKKERPDPLVAETILRLNQPEGDMCTACAWAKPANPSRFEFCENGAKATIWDLTSDRCTPEFFAQHSVTSLLEWSDHDLEMVGRLTHPMRYEPNTDHYVPCSWDEAFDLIGEQLQRLDPESVVFYASGRASLETSYVWALFARLYGHNNLPDSSNMCHETTSVGLKKVIGSSVGTCVLDDFEHCDMLFFFGQNTGTNSPRMLHPLQEASRRGCKVITFNPVRERGLIEFANPQEPLQMLSGKGTPISDRYLQVKPGGDLAVLTGLCKHVLELDAIQGNVLDEEFISEHTHGFDRFAACMADTQWDAIEKTSGISCSDIKSVAAQYARSSRVIGVYGMGLTQHVHGFQNIAMLINLLLLRGNIGKRGAGISPVRGHSNVQGQRTVGISEKPELVPLKQLAEQFDFTPPTKTGFTTVEAAQGVLDGRVKAFISLGGNFARAIPDQANTDAAWSSLTLNVQIATKLNRSHLLVGSQSVLLPCLVRSEEDRQASGTQAVTLEDSLSHIHGSIGKRTPASDMLRSELSIVAGMAKATLTPNARVPWDQWVGDYSKVREQIAITYPEEFADFNDRMFTPGGFYRGNSARRREWATTSGKAEFTTPTTLSALREIPATGDFTLITLRSNDQFNTTIYGFSDRLRGLDGAREIVMMNPEDMQRAGLVENQKVMLEGLADRSPERRVINFKVVAYDLPLGCVGAYYPETNALIPLNHHDVESKTPAYKGCPVRVQPMPTDGQDATA